MGGRRGKERNDREKGKEKEKKEANILEATSLAVGLGHAHPGLLVLGVVLDGLLEGGSSALNLKRSTSLK